MRTVLHLGCGNQPLPSEWDGWREVRVDGDPNVRADIVADVRKVPLEDEFADAVFCSHILEHLPETSVLPALSEWSRLLKDDGELVLTVPDIQMAAQRVADGRACEVWYESDAGPVRALDVIYGMAALFDRAPLMSHLTGFTDKTLTWWLVHAGFEGQLTRAEDERSLLARVRRVRVPAETSEPVILQQQQDPPQGAVSEAHVTEKVEVSIQ